MAEFGFTQDERNKYFNPEKVYSSFGRDLYNDFLVLCVYDLDYSLLVEKTLALDEVDFVDDGDYIDINVGQHLRDLGFIDGEYEVEYKFLRRLAGRTRPVYVDSRGIVYNGEVQRRMDDDVIRYYKSPGKNERNTNQLEELFIREFKYPITDISPERTEFILSLDERIQNVEYKNDLVEMGQMIEYKPVIKGGSGTIKFDPKNPYQLEFEIDDTDRGFTQNMVGGQLIIPRLYKVTGLEDEENEDYEDIEEDIEVEEEIEEDDIQYDDFGFADPLGPNGGGRS